MLIVANKFQTGFDQPLLQTMYVDKETGRCERGADPLPIEPDALRTSPAPWSSTSPMIPTTSRPPSSPTTKRQSCLRQPNPNLLYEVQTRLKTYPVFTDEDVDAFAGVFFGTGSTQAQLYAALTPSVQRFSELQEDERQDFRGQATDYVRLYSFLAQVITFLDADLEKLYVFTRHLRRLLRVDREELPLEIQQNIDMESYRVQQTANGKVALERKGDTLDPVRTKEPGQRTPEELEALSRIIADLNERFGIELGPEHRITLGRMMERLEEDAALWRPPAKVNTLENVRITFDHKVEQVIQEIIDLNFDLYKRITDDPAFGEVVKNHLFDQYLLGRHTPLSGKSGAGYEVQ